MKPGSMVSPVAGFDCALSEIKRIVFFAGVAAIMDLPQAEIILNAIP
jgi:hypothetical protein